MPHQASHTFREWKRWCDVCGEVAARANHCQQCPDYDECDDCFRLPSSHERSHTFQQLTRSCDICGKISGKTNHCNQCPDYDECDDCFNLPKTTRSHVNPLPNNIPTSSRDRSLDLIHQPYHRFQTQTNNRPVQCDACQALVKMAYHCMDCPDYDECWHCFLGAKEEFGTANPQSGLGGLPQGMRDNDAPPSYEE
ncbi:hypothetical protein DL93DRAFT_2080280 [Clavulina sp. PMI_390]|nr:hypothetical protein DL93DRAFT_2091831 [Clavulina sp. PMI_390]KAF8314202.1 hypothetical protein DL93DRAFT_2080280 [Clavulina sp. PMI_390]